MGRLLALWAALILGAVIAWRSQTPPAPAGLQAPRESFSAARAMADVNVIARAPHPIGSPQNHEVRDHLLRRMAALGLEPRVQRAPAFVFHPRGEQILGARVENLIGVLPGRDRGQPAVALMAHYDSVPGSPGAADDAAGVSAALEIVRAVQARGEPARDLAVVLTDGEEAGLLGASAFLRADPLARRLGFVLNMEARGGGGRALMFETGAGSGAAIDLFARTAPRPQASSLASLIYGRMPNDTDFSLVKGAGIAGFNFALLGRQFDYHSPTSTPANLDAGALQDMGDQVLAQAAALVFAPALPPPAPDRVYSPLFGDLMIVHSPPWGWLPVAAAAALIALAVARARRIAPFPWSEIPRGAGALMFAAVGAASMLHFARRATGAGFGHLEQRVLLAQAIRWEAALLLIGLGFLILSAAELARGRRTTALLPLAAGLAGSAFGGFDPAGLALGVAAALLGLVVYGRAVGRSGAWAGVLLAGLAAAAAVQALAPAAAFILAWPLLLAASGAAVTGLAARGRRPFIALLSLIAAVGLGWAGGAAHLAFLSLDLPELLVLPLWMAALLIWPLAQPVEGAPPARLVGPIMLSAGLALLMAVALDPPWSARRPRAVQVTYLHDRDDGVARRVSEGEGRTPWIDQALTTDAAAVGRFRHWTIRGSAWAAPAERVQLPGSTVMLARAGRALTLRVTPPPGARRLDLELRPNTALRATAIAGLAADVPLPAGHWTRVRWESPAQGLELRLAGYPMGRLDVREAAVFDAWPRDARPLPPPPADQMAFAMSGSAWTSRSHRLAW